MIKLINIFLAIKYISLRMPLLFVQWLPLFCSFTKAFQIIRMDDFTVFAVIPNRALLPKYFRQFGWTTSLCSPSSQIELFYQNISDNSDGRLHCVRRHPKSSSFTKAFQNQTSFASVFYAFRLLSQASLRRSLKA